MNEEIIVGLTKAYWMELETTQNYIAASVNLDGVRAQEIKQELAADISEEIGHAQSFAKRINELGGEVPGSKEFRPVQDTLQPPADSTDVATVIRGVIDAETGACVHMKKLIKLCDKNDDYVTADLLTTILADEESHKRMFEGFLREYEK